MAARTIHVSNAVQLAAAIKSSRGGETILLAAGDYGALTIKGRMLSETVTIKSANPANDASFTDLRIDRSSGFSIENVDLNRPLKAGEADHTVAAYITGSSNIALAGIDFRGSMDGNAKNDGIALRVTGSSDIEVTESTFEQFAQAGTFSGSSGLTLSGNSVTGVVKGFTFATLTDSLVAHNDFIGVKTDWAKVEGVTFHDNNVSGFDPTVPPIATGKVIAVANAAQLAKAVASVTGGETILLASGDYGTLTINGRLLDNAVTIKSADAANDAVFANIRVNKSSGFHFDDVDVHRPLLAGEGDWIQAAYVSGSKDIDFTGVDFTGSLDNNPWNDGVGLRISGSQDVRIIDSTFEQWTNAATFSQVDGLVIAGNTVTDVREGLDFAAVHDVMIAQNRMFGFDPNYARGDHSDSIQFWNAGVNEGSSRVVIRDNIIMQGANGGTQGIFIGNESPAFRHSDFLIENNLYNGDARHGITVSGMDNAVIRGNTVTSAPGGALEAGINIKNSTGVLVADNITPLLLQNGVNADITFRNNLDVWDTKSKVGLTLSQLFEKPSGEMFSEANFVSKSSAGFHGVDGIGAASFDMYAPSSISKFGGLMQTLVIA